MIAARAALRVLPIVARVYEADIDEGSQNELLLQTHRAILATAVAAKYPTTDANVDAAANAAYNSVVRVGRAGGDAAAANAVVRVARAASANPVARAVRAANYATNAAARAANSEAVDVIWKAVDSDVKALDQESPFAIFGTDLWHGALPDWYDTAQASFRAGLDGPEWRFWRDVWYPGMRDGKPLNWDMLRDIAKLLDEDWEKGPGHVAGLISEIEARYQGGPLDQDALTRHLQASTPQFSLYADFASSVGKQVEVAIYQFKYEAPANVLPDGFELFEVLPEQYAALSVAFSTSTGEDVAALQRKINELNQTIRNLRSQLQVARQELLDARLTKVEAAQMRTNGEKLTTTLTNITLISALAMSASTFFGIGADDFTYENFKDTLRSFSEDMRNVEPAPEQEGELPSVSDT